MNLPEFSVKRFQFTIVVFLMLAVLGISSLMTIPKAEDPTFPSTNFALVAVLPGAVPADMERLVVDPIERRVKALDDVKSIKTTIEDSVAVVQVEFFAHVDADRKHDEITREVSTLRPELPKELTRMEVKEFRPSKVNIRQFALVSDTVPYGELETLIRSIKKRLEAVPGARTVEVSGLPKREVNVALDLERMAALGVTPLEVYVAISGDATNIPSGSLNAGTRRMSLRASGDYASLEEIESTTLRAAGNGALHVRDVAKVTLTEVEDSAFARFNGKRAVLLAVNQKEEQNIFETAKRIDAELTLIEHDLPASVHLVRGFDQSQNVSHRLSGFTRDFIIAILLVLITLLPLGLRASAVVMVSIPLSLAVGVFLLKVTGFSINQLSIVGFVIALGLLVDDSVVVVENIARFLRLGFSPKDAAIRATRQITVSVLGCTATLLFAFLPLLFLPGLPGKFIRSLPVAVVFTVGASLLVSLTVVPFLASRLLKAEGEHGNLFFRGMTWLIEGSYRRVLERAIRNPKLTLVGAALLFAGSIALVPKIGFSLFPKAGTPQFMVNVETDEGSTLAETDRAVRHVEQVLARHKAVKNVSANIGKGNPYIYYNIAPHNEKANVAEVFAELEGIPHAERDELFAEMRRELSAYAGAIIELKEFENGPPIEAPIAFRLLGDDNAAIRQAALQVEDALHAVAGTRGVRNPSRDEKTDLRVKIDRERAALYGASVPDVDRLVRLSVGGLVAGSYRADLADEEREIRITALRSEASRTRGPSLESLRDTYVPTQKRAVVPLALFADVELESGQTALRHYNTERSALVTAFTRDGFNTDRVTQAALTEINKRPLPKGVRLVVAGEVESRKESFGGLGTAIIVAAFGVLAVLILEFRTFKGTLIVASVIPLGVVGGLVALFLSGNTLSFTATIGFIALMGIEVKNSILLVDFTNQLRQEGMGIDAAIQKAGEVRFVPILLTTMTAIGGLLPLALEGSALYSPLALVLLGGLVSSTILTRIVTPVLYKLLAPEVEAVAPEDRDGATSIANGEVAHV